MNGWTTNVDDNEVHTLHPGIFLTHVSSLLFLKKRKKKNNNNDGFGRHSQTKRILST